MATVYHPPLKLEFSRGDPILDLAPTWTDITAYLRSNWWVRRGRSDELGRFEAGTASFTLDNRDRRFEPYFTAGAYTPDVVPRRRIRLTAGVHALDLPGTAGNYASTPDAAALDITGNIDIRAKVALDNWTAPPATSTLVSKRETGATASYGLRMEMTTGRVGFIWSADGTAILSAVSTVAPGFANGSVHWVRATLDVDNGAAGRDIKFYTSDDGVTWTQLGATATQAGVTSVFSSTSRLEVGSIFAGTAQLTAGVFHYAEVRNGIDGTVVANPSFNQYPGTTQFTDSAGLPWTVNGAGSAFVLTAETQPIFDGLIDEWLPSYPDGLDGICTVTASDLLAHLATVDLEVPYVYEVLLDEPTLYLRLTDPGTADSLGNVIAADTSGNNRFGVYNGPTLYLQPDPITDDQDGAVTFDGIDDYILCNPVPMSSTFTVELWFKGNPAADGRFIHQEGIGASGVTVDFSVFMVASTGVINFQFGQATGSTWQCTSAVAPRYDDDEWHHLVGITTGSSIALLIDSVDVTTAPNTTGVPQFATTPVLYVGRGASPVAPQPWAGSLCEIALYPTNLSAARVTDHYDARTAGLNEGTQARIHRVGRYADLDQSVFMGQVQGGDALMTSAGNMGAQTALEAVRFAEITEPGALFVGADGVLAFRKRSAAFGGFAASTTSRLTLAGATGAVGTLNYSGTPVFEASRFGIANRVTASRRNGTTHVAADGTSRTKYGPLSLALSVGDSEESETRSRASWELSKRKDPARLKVRRVSLLPEPQISYQLLGLELWHRVTVQWAPPGGGSLLTHDALITGIEHRYSNGRWEVSLSLSATEAEPAWRIGTVGSSELGTTTRLFY